MTEVDILDLSEKKFASWQDTDIKGFSKIFDEHGLIFTEENNTITKSQVIAQMESQECSFEKLELRNTVARIFGTSAVVHGEGNFKLSESGKSREINLNFLDVWVEKDQGWQLVSSHYSSPA